MHWARLDLPRCGRVCVVNLHASAGRPEQASGEVVAAAHVATQLSGDDPLILGGDFNLRPGPQPEPFAPLRERFGLGEPTAPRAIDHLLARGLRAVERPRQLAPEEREVEDATGLRIRLSDHAPVIAEFVR